MVSMHKFVEDSLPDSMEVIKKSIKYCRKMGYVVDGKVRIDYFNKVLDMFQKEAAEMAE